MAFTYGQLPMVVSFYDALERFNSTKPIRGRTPEVRPLGIRRRHEASIDVEIDTYGAVECVNLKLWGHKLISFWKHEPHVAVINANAPYSASTTTASFIKEVTGFNCYLNDGKLKFYVGDGVHTIFDGMKIGRLDNRTSCLNVLNPEPSHAYRVDRKALREEMEKYQPFVEYITNVSKIVGEIEIYFISEEGKRITDTASHIDVNGFNKSYMRELEKTVRTDRAKFLSLLKEDSYNGSLCKSAHKTWKGINEFLESVKDACNVKDYEAMSELYKVLMYHAGECWRNRFWGHQEKDKVGISCSPVTMLARFRDLVKVRFAHIVFRKEELPQGKDVRDSNERFVLFNKTFNFKILD